MKTFMLLLLSVFLSAVTVPTSAIAGPKSVGGEHLPFEAVKMIIEFNSTAQDVGVQLFFDADEAWRNVTVVDPNGQKIFVVNAKGTMRTLGGSELFTESDEPGLDEVPIQDLFDRFPEGTYTFLGTSVDEETLVSTAKFTHKIPDGPTITSPATLDPDDATIRWNGVVTPAGIQIAGYEVVIEKDDFHVFDVKLPGSARSVTVPPQFLEHDNEYLFEVLAIEKGGNQTITESSFETN